MNSTTPELLAPAGGWPQLRAALQAGADAVFFGAGKLNMRARAKNFSVEELPEVCNLCQQSGAKAYLTLNTLVYESELSELETVVSAAKSAGVDAVIAADFAVIRAAARHELPVHISTQMSVSNSETLRLFMEMGIRRVVLARECSLEDIRQMQIALGSRASELSLEVFAHGAMCVAVSGRCFLSGFDSGRSASRGECAQPCRQEYRIQSPRGGEGFSISGSHLLSPKDLCTLPFLEQLLDAGVSSLKIEGRNRSPDYVLTVVSVYREALDFYQSNRGEENFLSEFEHLKTRGMEKLEKVYHRGFSEGFYMGKPLGDWSTPPGNQSSCQREYIGQILRCVDGETEVQLRLESSSLQEGEEVFSESPEQGFQAWSVSGMKLGGRPCSEAPKGSLITLPRQPFMHQGQRTYRQKLRLMALHGN
ncbi:MAG: peptidase U32 family protein [Kiritimatiellia bacterium]